MDQGSKRAFCIDVFQSQHIVEALNALTDTTAKP